MKAKKWKGWADWMLGKDDGVKGNDFPLDHYGVTYYDSDDIHVGTVEERAMYAYFLYESEEPF